MLNPKELPAPLRLKYIVDAMAMRARGRDARKAAEAKRVKRAYKRLKTALGATEVRRTHRYEGEVDDALYGNSVHLGLRPWEASSPSSVLAFKHKERANVL